MTLNRYIDVLLISSGGAGDAGYGASEPAYGGSAQSYDSYSQPSYNSYQQPQSQYNNNYGK